MGECYSHLTYEQRQKLEHMHNKLHTPVRVMADTLEVERSTIYRELKRGMCEQLDKHFRTYQAYSAQLAQQDYEEKASHKGPPLKLGNDYELAAYIEDKIVNHHYSPDAVIGQIRAERMKFKVSICTTTLYNYIGDGVFLKLSNKHLLRRRNKKRKYKKIVRMAYANVDKTSIDERPKTVEKRESFGHWEMDTVYGKQNCRSTCLLVLTERKQRHEIIIKIKERTAKEVVKALDGLHRKYGKLFRHIFKTITVDNGGEFADVRGMEKGGRTKVYYCHPFRSSERGSNENANGIIRRFIPKGADISKYTNKQIAEVQSWMNAYPRKILGYKTSGAMFNAELTILQKQLNMPKCCS